MEKRSKMDWWCDRAWIKFGLGISGIMTIAVLWFWNDWSLELKLLAAMSAIIPLHVVEEWVFPGGFHYQYNTVLYKSDKPDRYPMCRKSDMFTNLIVTIMYAVLTFCYALKGQVHTGLILGSICFCALEVIAHTAFGCIMLAKFRNAGKTTIYGPGSITAYFGFFIFGVLFIYSLSGRSIVSTDWIVAVGLLLFILVVGILIPEGLSKSKESPYFFKSAGYFERFLR